MKFRSLFAYVLMWSPSMTFAQDCQLETATFLWQPNSMSQNELAILRKCVDSRLSIESQASNKDGNSDAVLSTAIKKVTQKRKCPPGPFKCVPWGPAPIGPKPAPPPPPPPFFEVQMRKDLEFNSKSYGEWREGVLIMRKFKEISPDHLKGFKAHADSLKSHQFYFLPSDTDPNSGLLFHGSELAK